MTFSQPSSTTQSVYPASPSPFHLRKSPRMSIAQTYLLAHRARAKLSSEAARPDHNLRLLVGHANLLDSLMLELADAEREQESWFYQSVRGATQSTPPAHSYNDRHIQWADSVEEPEHDWRVEDAGSDSDSDSDCSYDEEEDDEFDEDVEMADAVVALRRIPSHTSMLPPKGYNYQDEEEDYDMDDEEDYNHLALQRTPSHSGSPSPSSPPELLDDSDSTTDDESSMPPSPPTTMLPAFDDKKSTTIHGATGHGDKDAFYEEGFYLPPRNAARISVY
ncbi:hypothetical protein QBC40DRAFT_285514 [Triangularia verruculosa]|uniref:Protein ECM13 n=1 Tax=Triangularia verruculosa TaxID=2587418 RepID=A0AAN6XBG7_9PEZI|nr:hypothetical protein QBC40DRAFT_285514 [Triangularia verruculosa]